MPDRIAPAIASGSSGAALKWSCTPVKPQARTMRFDLFEAGIDEDSYLFNCRRQMGDDPCRFRRRNAPWTGREDKSHSVGTRIDGQTRVGERGVAADFDPEA